ncbi:hypothetical protein K2X96_04085 [Patescibacteria group bacterium]|nr:hypothetical protein [Patescibacteria group bacterium]
MTHNTLPSSRENWERLYREDMERIRPLLTKHELALDPEQPHTQGERFLMQAVTTESGRKLILLGTTKNGKRIVIKITKDPQGKKELVHERACRTLLKKIRFAYDVFFSPEEILFIEEKEYLIAVYVFIEQECAFLERPIEKQFAFALRAFKAQESAHATTWAHRKLIENSFTRATSNTYIQTFKEFKEKTIAAHATNTDLSNLYARTLEELERNKETIEQYTDFLTHVDFVPHNFRIQNNTIYLLDHSSLRFGNKYEGWARFLNFMVLYNKPLEEALVSYVKNNRSPEETLSLHLMRLYRLGEIIWYYTRTLERSEGNLLALNTKRISFWSKVLEAALRHESVNEEMITEYKKSRDLLRSDDEKQRQVGLH